MIYIFASTTDENVQFDLVYSMNTDKYGYSDVMDINCNVNFSLDTSIFPDGIIPDIYEMYFRVPSFQIKILL